MKVLALTKYDREAASTRQRLLQYLPALAAAGIEVDYQPLLDDAYIRSLTGNGRASRVAILSSYLARLKTLSRRPDANLIWVYAELFPWLPAWFEGLVHRWGIPVVYDYDDAFFVPYDGHPRSLVRGLLTDKLRPLIQGAAACTCGNEYLREYAQLWCERSMVVPTVVDTDRYVPAARAIEQPVIGWIGSPTTWANVRPLLPLLARLHRETGVRIRAVGAGKAAEADRFQGLELVDWTEASEIAEVQRFTIGIMPLLDAPFQRGKSGYKLIQYMACGLPTVASPVGVNQQIVVDGTTGLLATTEDEWEKALRRLLDDRASGIQMGGVGRHRAVEHYSLASQAPRLIRLFRELAKQDQEGRAAV
ncbi:glycosyltransferase family 4 protein [Sphingomonas sp. KRR8]|uniref:glycosyltransferase family 4 protein n=1 Tax=Sphingomonas sp. KRR8 TaxID=2942996 RepID=UPI0020222A82|nr:glycosyltransferase family 4 protein [Sphingomonas sp. KRR8]URD61584.1 glycosyltransferase family 4 protein [Sphingomonas sp. KRR8]